MASEPKTAVKAMIKTAHLHRTMLEHMVTEIGINRTTHMILMDIYHSEQPLSQKQLADKLEVSAAAVTVTAKKLVDEGYISRQVSKTDNRYYELSLTERGKDVICRTKEVFESIDGSMFDGFSEEEISLFIEFNERLTSNLKALKEKSDIERKCSI